MRLLRRSSGAVAFTLIELLCVIAIIGILAALVLPAVNRARGPAKQVQCISQLHNVGMAFQIFAHDHNNRFPMAVPREAGGSLEFVQNAYRIGGDFYFGFRHFQVLSNELSSPKLLLCPVDTRLPAANFWQLKNENVSYFIGVGAAPEQPMSVLAGDRNIVLVSPTNTGTTLLRLNGEQMLRWTEELHEYKGNLLFADGHVERRNGGVFALAQGTGAGGVRSIDLILPSVKGSGLSMAPARQVSALTPDRNQAPAPAPPPGPTNKPSLAGNSALPASNLLQIAGQPEVNPWVITPPVIVPSQPEKPAVAQSNGASARPGNPGGSGTGPPLAPGFPESVFAELAPLLREFGWWLYLLLLVLVLLTLLVRYYFTRRSALRKQQRFD